MKISFDMQCNRLNLFYRKRADNSKYSTRLCRWKDRMELTDWVWHCTKYRYRQGKQQTTARQSALSDKWSECDILARIPGSSWGLPTAVPSAPLTTSQMIHEISFYLLRNYFSSIHSEKRFNYCIVRKNKANLWTKMAILIISKLITATWWNTEYEQSHYSVRLSFKNSSPW